MSEGSETHYQISLTGGQILGLVFALFAALAVAFFFGVEAGLSRRVSAPAKQADAGLAAGRSGGETLPATSTLSETAPETAPGPTPPAPSRTRLAVPAGTAAVSTVSRPPVPASSGEVREGFGDLSPEEAEASRRAAEEESLGATGSPAGKVATRSAGRLATPQSEEKKSSGASAGATSEKFYVQVISTSSRDEAERMAQRLKKGSYAVTVNPTETSKGRVFRVRVGPYASKEDATRIAAKLSRQEKLSVWVAPGEK